MELQTLLHARRGINPIFASRMPYEAARGQLSEPPLRSVGIRYPLTGKVVEQHLPQLGSLEVRSVEPALVALEDVQMPGLDPLTHGQRFVVVERRYPGDAPSACAPRPRGRL